MPYHNQRLYIYVYYLAFSIYMLKVHSPVVNSFHRQAVDKMPDGYRVAARSEDHHIEAIESISGPFRMGLQFHPEMLTEKIWKDFFVEFVNLVRTEKLNS